MKAKYIKPCITEDFLLSDEDLMINVVSDGGTTTVPDGGNTSESGITEGDSRPFKVWSDDED